MTSPIVITKVVTLTKKELRTMMNTFLPSQWNRIYKGCMDAAQESGDERFRGAHAFLDGVIYRVDE